MAFVFAAGAASGEIYKWKDAAGRLHFAQDLNQVPSEFRAQAEAGAKRPEAAPAVQHYHIGPAAPAPASTAGRPARPFGTRSTARGGSVAPASTYRIPVERAGSRMMVQVRLNDSVTAAFQIDTGATDVVIPRAVADQLGLDLTGARTGFYGTANGIIQQPLVTLTSVELGGARVENVPATVSGSMSEGLLGLSFFNHFRYDFDPGAGIVTLTPNGLAESGVLRGGRSEDQWRSQFDGLTQRRAMIESYLEQADPNSESRRAKIEDALAETDRQLEVLHREADDARVPMGWRGN